MIKQSLIAFGLAAALSTAAFGDGAFVGGEAGWLHSKAKNTNDSHMKASDNTANIGIKAGYEFMDMHRIYGAYNYQSATKDNYSVTRQGDATEGLLNENGSLKIKGVHKFLLGYDFAPKITENWRAVVGAYLGYAKSKSEISGVLRKASDNSFVENIKEGKSMRGFIYGAKIGGAYDIDEHNEIEFGFRAEQIKYKKFNDGGDDIKFKQTNYGLYAGYTYKF